MLLQEQYPEQWPSFFSELTAAAGEGTGAVDMFCRILMALDDDIISMDVPRWGTTHAHTPSCQRVI